MRYLAAFEVGAWLGAALGAPTAAGGAGQAVGSASGEALYGFAREAMFIAAFAGVLGALLAGRA